MSGKCQFCGGPSTLLCDGRVWDTPRGPYRVPANFINGKTRSCDAPVCRSCVHCGRPEGKTFQVQCVNDTEPHEWTCTQMDSDFNNLPCVYEPPLPPADSQRDATKENA